MKEFHRKFFHILTTTPFVVLGFFIDSYIPRSFYIVISFVLLALFLTFEAFRFKNPAFREKVMQRYGHMFKKEDENHIIASIWGPINLLVLVLFFSKPVIVGTLVVGSYSDPIAAMVGMKFGKKKNALGKTWAGTAAFFVSSVVMVFLALSLIHFSLPFVYIVLISLVTALAERYVPFGDDNVVIPLVFVSCFELVTHLFLKA